MHASNYDIIVQANILMYDFRPLKQNQINLVN